MIGYLRGKLLRSERGFALVVVSETQQGGGVGYEVVVPQSESYLLLKEGQDIELFIYTHVREDAFELYGFLTPQEKTLFLDALSVNGIGPKAGMNLLSFAEPSIFIQAVLQKNHDFLTQIPGIGKKTAERIVVELYDRLKKKYKEPLASVQPKIPLSEGNENLIQEAKEVLLGLGFKEAAVDRAIEKVYRDHFASEKSKGGLRVEDFVRLSLQQV